MSDETIKQLNNDKSVFDKLDHKYRTKSEIVFYKLLAKQKKPANPFGVVRSETWDSSTEIKQGADTND